MILKHWPLVLVLLIALTARLAVVAAAHDYPLGPEPREYDRHARSIVAGDGYPPTSLAAPGSPGALRPPAYPYLLAAVYKVRASWTLGKVAGTLLGTLTVLLIYLIAAGGWGRRVGWVAATLAAVFPPLVVLSSSLISEVLFLPLELGVVVTSMIYRRSPNQLRWALAAGTLCGLAALTRSVGVLLLLPAVVAVWTSRPRFAWRSLAAPALVLVAAIGVIAPWTIRNAGAFHSFVPISTQDGYNFAGGYNDLARLSPTPYPKTWRQPYSVPEFKDLFHRRGIDEADLNDELRDRAVNYALDHLGYAVSLTWRNTLRAFDVAGEPGVTNAAYREIGVPKAAYDGVTWSLYVAVALAALGVASLVGIPPRVPRPAIVWAVPGLMFSGVGLVSGLPRYRAPLDPFIVLLAALGVIAALRFARRDNHSAAPVS